MKIYTIKRYSRELIKQHPDKIFVFGDNLYRTGYGGQAGEARDEPNALGIITKFTPTNEKEAFFYESQLEVYKKLTANDFSLLKLYAKMDYDIVIPYDGIGTGLSKLNETAPSILSYIEEQFYSLFMTHKKQWINRYEDFIYLKNAIQMDKKEYNEFLRYVRNWTYYNAYDEESFPYRNVDENAILSFYFENAVKRPEEWKNFAPKFELQIQ